MTPTTTTTPADLTDRQKAVLELVRKGKSPTAIGKELGISSQGVHGHLRKLRERGLVDSEPVRSKKPRNGVTVNPAKALEAVRAAIDEQEQALLQRLSDIDEERQALDGEAAEIQATLGQLRALAPRAGEDPVVTLGKAKARPKPAAKEND